MNQRPANTPTCEHGHPVGGFHGCKECSERDEAIRKTVKPLVDEFWEHRGERCLDHLMLRAYRMGTRREGLPEEKTSES